jgi:hypothetical protein
MKKIMISLLMVAATLNAMAITYTGKAQLVLTSSDNKSCTLGLVESEDLVDGLNPGRYAVLNEEGKDVLIYVVYNNVKYETFASNKATMQDMQLYIKTNASTDYTLTAKNVTGTLKVRINGVDYTISAGMNEAITLPASSTLPAAGDEDKYKVQPSAPAAPEFCFVNEELKVNGFAGKKLAIWNADKTTAIVPEFTLGDTYVRDFSGEAANSKFIIVFDGLPAVAPVQKDYVIDVKPAVTKVNP